MIFGVFVYLFFSHILYLNFSFPSVLSSQFLPQPFYISSTTPLLFLFRKRAGLPGILTKHGITCFNTPRYISFVKVDAGSPAGGRQLSQRQPSLLLLGVLEGAKFHKGNRYTQDLGKTHTGSLIVSSVFVRYYIP